MKKIHVKDLMIPIADYVAVKKTDTLMDVMAAHESARQAGAHAHRDAVVVDDNGAFIGKVTMIDIFRALEPNYTKIMKSHREGILTKEFVMKAVKAFNLWKEPERSICQRGGNKIVADVMHVPDSFEYLRETDSLEKALNLYVTGVHQPLVVKDGDNVTGFLRFGDVYEVIRQALLNCEI
jgi:CBS domain containing-hemolysin-like protein